MARASEPIPPPPYKGRPKITVHCDIKTKKVSMDRPSFEAVQYAIKRRFQLTDDFQLQVEDTNGERIDIDDDEDLVDNAEFLNTMWVVKVRPCKPGERTAKKARDPSASSVFINSVKYSTTEAPGEGSEIVKILTTEMEEHLRINELVMKLEQVADFLRVIFYAARAMQDKDKDCCLYTYVTDLQSSFQMICIALLDVMSLMQINSGDALEDLLCGIQCMLDGFEDQGIQTISAIGEKLGTITKSVQTLIETSEHAEARNFVDEKDKEKVRRVLDRINTLELKEEGAKKAEKRYLESDSRFGFGSKKVFSLGFYQGSAKLAELEKRIGEEATRERSEQEQRLRELGGEEIQMKMKIDAFVAELNKTRDDPTGMTGIAIGAAQSAEKTLRSIMRDIVAFWKGGQYLFQSICDSKHFKAISEVEKSRKMDFLTGKVFKTQAIRSSARFVALRRMCSEFRRTTTLVLKNIDKVIADNPTADEAKEKLPGLLDDLKKKTGEKTAFRN